MRQVFPQAVPDVQVSKYPAPAQAGRQRTSAGLFIPLNFRPHSIRFLGESYLPRPTPRWPTRCRGSHYWFPTISRPGVGISRSAIVRFDWVRLLQRTAVWCHTLEPKNLYFTYTACLLAGAYHSSFRSSYNDVPASFATVLPYQSFPSPPHPLDNLRIRHYPLAVKLRYYYQSSFGLGTGETLSFEFRRLNH